MEHFFSKEHEWVKISGTTATVGISDHAAHELGDITFVELPQVGKKVRQFDTLAAIESVKAARHILAGIRQGNHRQ
jgi:glycine cleavage system H protein